MDGGGGAVVAIAGHFSDAPTPSHYTVKALQG